MCAEPCVCAPLLPHGCRSRQRVGTEPAGSACRHQGRLVCRPSAAGSRAGGMRGGRHGPPRSPTSSISSTMSYGTPAKGRFPAASGARGQAAERNCMLSTTSQAQGMHAALAGQSSTPAEASSSFVCSRVPLVQPQPRTPATRTCLRQQHVELAGHAARYRVHAKPAAGRPASTSGHGAGKGATGHAPRQAASHALPPHSFFAAAVSRPAKLEPTSRPSAAPRPAGAGTGSAAGA